VGCPLRRTPSAGHRGTVASPVTSLSSRWRELQSISRDASTVWVECSRPDLSLVFAVFVSTGSLRCVETPEPSSLALRLAFRVLLPSLAAVLAAARLLEPRRLQIVPVRCLHLRGEPCHQRSGLAEGRLGMAPFPVPGWPRGHPLCRRLPLGSHRHARFARQETLVRRRSAASPPPRSARKPDPARSWSRIDPCRSPRGAGTSPFPRRLQAPTRRPTPKRRAVHALTGSLPVHAGPCPATPSRRLRRTPCQTRRSSRSRDLALQLRRPRVVPDVSLMPTLTDPSSPWSNPATMRMAAVSHGVFDPSAHADSGSDSYRGCLPRLRSVLGFSPPLDALLRP